MKCSFVSTIADLAVLGIWATDDRLVPNSAGKRGERAPRRGSIMGLMWISSDLCSTQRDNPARLGFVLLVRCGHIKCVIPVLGSRRQIMS